MHSHTPGAGGRGRSVLRSCLPTPGAAPGSRLRDENDFENRGQRPQAYICHRVLTHACRGPGQSESNFINTVIKREGNYSKYWRTVRVTHEFGGYHVLFDTQWIDDSEHISSEVRGAVPPPGSAASPLRAPKLRGRSRFPPSQHTQRACECAPRAHGTAFYNFQSILVHRVE